MATSKNKPESSFKDMIQVLSETLNTVLLSTENETQDNILADVLEEKLEILNRRT
jgi:hypothetical protein